MKTGEIMDFNFYTNVSLVGDGILYRGIKNGVEIKRVEKYNPTLFVPTNEVSEYKTLNGTYVEDIQPGKIMIIHRFQFVIWISRQLVSVVFLK